jgi:hypothetical protein
MTQPEPTPEPTPDPQAQPDPKPTETVDFWKGKAREQEQRAKANAEAAKELQKIKDAQKSDEERRSEVLTAAERKAADAELRAERLEVAFAKGLTPAQAKRLAGSTRDELEADAEEVLRDFPVSKTPPAHTGGPRQTSPIGDDMNELIRRSARR